MKEERKRGLLPRDEKTKGPTSSNIRPDKGGWRGRKGREREVNEKLSSTYPAIPERALEQEGVEVCVWGVPKRVEKKKGKTPRWKRKEGSGMVVIVSQFADIQPRREETWTGVLKFGVGGGEDRVQKCARVVEGTQSLKYSTERGSVIIVRSAHGERKGGRIKGGNPKKGERARKVSN